MAREIVRGDVLCEALLVSAYHRININFFFSVATPSASHVLRVCTGYLSHKPTYIFL